MSSEIKPGGTLGNLKFNTVGREEAAAQVLTPQVDPAVRNRNIVIAIVAVLVLGIFLMIGAGDSLKKIFSPPANKSQFQAPDHNIQ